jgi:glycerate kinase
MGAGAAGGLGFGLQAFLGAKPVGGFKLFSQAARLSDRLKTVDLVITGEGALDDTSIMGKATGSLAALCRRRRIPCVALAGVVNLPDRMKSPFQVVRAMVDLTTESEARKNPARWLEVLAEKTAREWGRVTSDEREEKGHG